MKLPIRFRIRPQQVRSEDELTENASEMQAGALGSEEATNELSYETVAEFLKRIADIATCVWKARTRMVDSASGQVREEMKRIYGDMERIYKCFDELGIVVKDHTNETFDYGLPLKVITTKPMAINEEIVTETLKPTIYWQGKIIQHGEVEVGTPSKPEES
jgi:hypothetical protein